MYLLIARRLALVPIVALIVVTAVFVILRVLPGDPVDVLLATSGTVLSDEDRSALAMQLGLDQSLWVQYREYLLSIIELDPGVSFYSGVAVSSLISATLPATVELAVASTIVMIGLGVPAGIIAARTRGSVLDGVVRFSGTLAFSIPWFWLGVVLIVIFGVMLGILPIAGRFPATISYQPITNFVLIDAILTGEWELIGPWIRHMILPALTLGLPTAGFLLRITRASVLETMDDSYVRTARMKGMKERRVFGRHIFRNAGLPILTIVGLQFGSLLGGAIVAEVVFSYPGIGRLLVSAIGQRDYALVQSAVLILAMVYILVNTATDIVYLYVDPRVRSRLSASRS